MSVNKEKLVQVKEEEEAGEEQPAAKRKRGQGKSQTKTKNQPKEEMKSEGNTHVALMKKRGARNTQTHEVVSVFATSKYTRMREQL